MNAKPMNEMSASAPITPPTIAPELLVEGLFAPAPIGVSVGIADDDCADEVKVFELAVNDDCSVDEVKVLELAVSDDCSVEIGTDDATTDGVGDDEGGVGLGEGAAEIGVEELEVVGPAGVSAAANK